MGNWPRPCGPCSEIYIDLGEARGCGKDTCAVGCNCDRYLEIWNLVFTQFDRDEAGNYTPLAKKNIDTGAGLERIASVLQNKPSNFETDLLFPIIEHTASLTGLAYGGSAKTDISMKVIADHARSMTVMIADGVLPSNEGRGYVLRRILRRAVRHGRLMGLDKPFLAAMVDIVAKIFAIPYPEIGEKRAYIMKVIQLEEERFSETLLQGMELLNIHVQEIQTAGQSVLAGAAAFKLYDTFGFPWELTQEILDEHGIELDKTAFDFAMNEQRERARAARQDRGDGTVLPDLSGIVNQELSYDAAADDGQIMVILKEGAVLDGAFGGDEIAVILGVTAFHAEGGGQVGDCGFLVGSMGRMEVRNTKKLPDGTIYHVGVVTEGVIKTGDSVKLVVNLAQRAATARNHTATHLLQAALKQVLGSHVNQAGSQVDSDRLRFDFSRFAPVSEQEVAQVEAVVNQAVLANLPIGIIETTQDVAKEMGATALFGEKYGTTVRVVMAGNFSKELCGGTHVDSTAQIGLFKIVSEAGIGAGLRRIEAVTGAGANLYVNSQAKLLNDAAAMIKSRTEDLPVRVEALVSLLKETEQALVAANTKLAKFAVQDLLAGAEKVGTVELVVGQVSASDMDDLRSIADMVRDRLASGAVILAATSSDKVNFVAMATANAVAQGLHAGNIVKAAASLAGGGGGGRADMAQAGGKFPDKTAAALKAALDLAKSQLNKEN